METMKIAVPSNAPGGLDGTRSEHFGHCDIFTLIDIKDGKISEVSLLDNEGHGAGGCMEPVGLLKDQGIDAIVVGGMGARPLQGFQSVGIKVYFANRESFGNVQAVVDGMVNNHLVLMQPSQACQGHGDCHGEGSH